MDKFARCFGFTIDAEGGYTADAADPGNWTGGAVGRGALHGTKYGISAAAYPALDIAALTAAEAEAVYRRDYWAALQGEALPLPLAMVAFDAAVNAGRRRAVMWLQQAAGLAADGVLGAESLAALLAGDAVALAREALARRLDYYARLPSWANFGLGWSRRLVALAGAIVA
jgi:lysozyme family protein